MSVHVRFLAAAVMLHVAALPAPAGPLSPPAGPVSSTHHSLIFSLPHTISAPGSYALARDLTGIAGDHGIRIAASDVTLDLRGFTLRGVPGSLSGVFVDGPRTNVAVCNGTVTQWGGCGVNAASATRSKVASCTIPDNDDDGACGGDETECSNTSATGNGGKGINVGSGSKITGCTAAKNTEEGVSTGGGSQVTGTSSRQNGAGGIATAAGSLVRGCLAQSNGADGISTGDGSSVSGCTSNGNAGSGVVVGTGGSVDACVARANAVDGVRVQSFTSVTGNTCYGNGTGAGVGAGVRVGGTGCRVDGNTVTLNEVGVAAESVAGRNFIVRNAASRNSSMEFDVHANNTLGQVINAVGVPAFAADNSWANVLY